MGKFDKYWEMKIGGPHEDGAEAFKCTECGGETEPEKGWNGEPNTDNCQHGCSVKETGLTVSVSRNIEGVRKICGCFMGTRCDHPGILEVGI